MNPYNDTDSLEESRKTAQIFSFLKKQGILNGEDYRVSKNTFIAKDIEAAQSIADALAGSKYDIVIHDDKETSDGEIPIAISEANSTATTSSVNGMGSTSMPGIGDGSKGSGDIPYQLGGTAKNKNTNMFKKFDEFVSEMNEETKRNPSLTLEMLSQEDIEAAKAAINKKNMGKHTKKFTLGYLDALRKDIKSGKVDPEDEKIVRDLLK